MLAAGSGLGRIISQQNIPVFLQEFVEKMNRIKYKAEEVFVEERKVIGGLTPLSSLLTS